MTNFHLSLRKELEGKQIHQNVQKHHISGGIVNFRTVSGKLAISTILLVDVDSGGTILSKYVILFLV